MKADDLILTVIKKSDSDEVRDHFHLELEKKRDQVKNEIEKKFGKNLKSGIGILRTSPFSAKKKKYIGCPDSNQDLEMFSWAVAANDTQSKNISSKEWFEIIDILYWQTRFSHESRILNFISSLTGCKLQPPEISLRCKKSHQRFMKYPKQVI